MGSTRSPIKSCTFCNNSAGIGGALFQQNGQLMELLLYNCTFCRNIASLFAGALCLNRTSATILHTTFVENVYPWGGAILFSGLSKTLLLSNCRISQNNYAIEQNSRYEPAVVIAHAKKVQASNVIFESNNGGALDLGETEGEVHNLSETLEQMEP